MVREKQKTNIRTHAADEAIKLAPPREVTLETAIEFIADDELVEVTPASLRLRKRILKEHDRRRPASAERQPVQTGWRAWVSSTAPQQGPVDVGVVGDEEAGPTAGAP